jgi:hypothetical protein
MTMHEKKLIRIFLWILVAALFTIFCFSTITNIHTLDESIALYEEKVQGFSDSPIDEKTLTNQIEALSKNLSTPTAEKAPASDLTAHIRQALQKNGILPLRYTLQNDAGGTTIEFTLRCKPESFFAFLKSDEESSNPSSFTTLSIKPVKSSHELDVVFRVTQHEE